MKKTILKTLLSNYTKIFGLILVAYVLSLALIGCGDTTTKDIPQHQFKWDVSVCNSVGCDHYYCDSYERDGDTYKLLQSDTITNVIQIVPGIAIIFSKN